MPPRGPVGVFPLLSLYVSFPHMRFLSTLAASVIGTLIAFGALVLFLFLFFFAISLSSDTTPTVSPGSILVVNVDGPIPERVSDDPLTRRFEDQPNYDLSDLQQSLSKAKQDDRISGVWIRVKGTSSSWATLEEAHRAITEVRESGKPVIASSSEFGMSEKAYYLASAADSVFTGPVSGFEFNGIYFPQTFFKGTLEKLNVEPKVVRAGQYKSAVETFTRETLSENNRYQLEEIVGTFSETYLQAVSEQRNLSMDALQRLIETDAPMSSEAAVEAGLADDIRYEDEVRDVLRGILEIGDDASIPTIDVAKYARVPASEVGMEPVEGGSVAIVYAEGTIQPGDPGSDPFSGGSALGSTPFIDALDDARTDDDVKAVVVRVNSPGGSASASEAMWRAMERTTQQKPVIVSMGDLAASGGYYIAAPADTIVADATTITGSIGVFGLSFNVRGLLNDKLGISVGDISTSPLADMNSGLTSYSDQERELVAESIDRTYQTFLQRVADGRGMTIDEVDAVAQGRVWSGADAKEQDLVDVVGGFSDAITLAGQAGGLGDGPYSVRVLPREKTFFEKLNQDLSGQAASIWQQATTSPVEQQIRRYKAMIEAKLGKPGTVQARMTYDFSNVH